MLETDIANDSLFESIIFSKYCEVSLLKQINNRDGYRIIQSEYSKKNH